MEINMKILRFLVLSVIPLIFLNSMAAAESIIVANKTVTQTSVSKEDVELIFLGKKKKWDNGEMIRLAALKKGAVNETFLREYVNKNSSSYRSFWKIAVVSGTARPPKFFKDEEDLVEYVAEKEGAIGYISFGTPHEGLKILDIE